ncbi:protein amnionless [Vipera latastei]
MRPAKTAQCEEAIHHEDAEYTEDLKDDTKVNKLQRQNDQQHHSGKQHGATYKADLFLRCQGCGGHNQRLECRFRTATCRACEKMGHIASICRGSSVAVYKQWIPNTNFENAANWDQNRVPCAKDAILFGSSKIVSIFVQASHSLTDMYLPLNGEFIMAPGAGFAAFDGNYNPGCETASEITFKSTDNYEWYDPTIWHAANSLENLDLGKYIFLVDEERVPCQYDDVIFQPETSFRVNINSEQVIQLKSISIMGQNFTSDSALTEYMQSSSARLQFHGQGTLRLSHTRCPDKSGCECGNSASHERICAALLQNSRNECPMVTCKDAIKPTGHCCEICGVILTLTYSADFDIEVYRDRIFYTFLNLPRNKGVQMAMSKMKKLQTPLRIVPRGLDSIIQIVLIDNKTGPYAGTHAEQLANDILKDIADHGFSQ